MIRTYAIGAATAAFLGLSGALWLTWSALDASKAENAALVLQLSGCNARVGNISKDKESDDEIDNVHDDGLRDVPVDWMLPPGSGGIY